MWFEDAIGRLKAQVTGMREIDGASSLEAAMRGAVATPSLYLIPLTETGRELAHTGPLDQQITVLFAVLFALDTARSAQGMDVLVELHTHRSQVRAALGSRFPIIGVGGITGDAQPLLIYADQPKVSGGN